MRISFVSGAALFSLQSIELIQALPIEAAIDQTPASTLPQSSASAEEWEHADVAGILMGFIGGIFQGMGLSDTFGQGRDQKENLFTTIKKYDLVDQEHYDVGQD